jgi:hypothetical protein
VAWSVLAPKVEEAIKAGGFWIAFRQAPLYTPDPWRSRPNEPGAGYCTGEAQLVRLPHDAWLSAPSYSSLLACVEMVADPRPTRKDLGSPDAPMIWNVTAEVGSVQTYDGADHHAGIRHFTKSLPPDPEFGWIPAAIISYLG